MSSPAEHPSTPEIIQVWEYLAETAEQYANQETGLKEEYKGLCFASYCVALQHIAYALDLPVELEDFDESSTAVKRIKAKFGTEVKR